MTKPKPACQVARSWLRQQKVDTAPLTGQDARALAAFAHLVDLYLCSDDAGRCAAIRAMRECLLAMQPKCRSIAVQAIPAVGDWAHVAELTPYLMLGAEAPVS